MAHHQLKTSKHMAWAIAAKLAASGQSCKPSIVLLQTSWPALLAAILPPVPFAYFIALLDHSCVQRFTSNSAIMLDV